MKAKKRSKLEKAVLAYVTAKDRKEALSIGETLIEKRMTTCINVIPTMFSVYRWKGKVERGRESILIVKTLVSKKRALVEEIKRLHSYSVPCVLFIPVGGGNADYLQWLNREI